MIGIVYDDNGTKKIKPLAGSSGSGLPLGTILPLYTSSVPTGYLPCDGSTFDASEFPALYGLLGTNVLPDLREVTLVGAGQNTTNTIAAHDVYTIGQFKDDQLQKHVHSLRSWPYLGASSGYNDGQGTSPNSINSGFNTSYPNTDGSDGAEKARTGTTTHGKQTGVNYVIKAVSGITEADKDYVAAAVANEIKDGDAYSTTEIKTNKTWINGKPIYRKVYEGDTNPTQGQIIETNVAHIVNQYGTIMYSGIEHPFPRTSWTSANGLGELQLRLSSSNNVYFQNTDVTTWTGYKVIIEYTKTTD